MSDIETLKIESEQDQRHRDRRDVDQTTADCHSKGFSDYHFRWLWAQAAPQPYEKESKNLKSKIAQKVRWIAQKMHFLLVIDQDKPENSDLCILE